MPYLFPVPDDPDDCSSSSLPPQLRPFGLDLISPTVHVSALLLVMDRLVGRGAAIPSAYYPAALAQLDQLIALHTEMADHLRAVMARNRGQMVMVLDG